MEVTMTTTTTTKTHWTEQDLFPIDGGAPLTSRSQPEYHHRVMREYRETGAIAGWYLVQPASGSPEEMDRVSYEGPEVDEIDWTGFDDALALDMIAEVESMVGSDGTDNIGVCVREALRASPEATAAEIADGIREAREEARAEREACR